MKKALLIQIFVFSILACFSQDRTYTLRKTMSPLQGNADFTFWKFPSASFASTVIDLGDTVDFSIAVDLAKDNPVVPSLALKVEDMSGATKSLTITGTVKASQFHLLSLEPTAGISYSTVSRTVTVNSKTAPVYVVLADSVNPGNFVIPKRGVNHLRSVLYSLRLIPLASHDSVKVTGVYFKSWVDPAY